MGDHQNFISESAWQSRLLNHQSRVNHWATQRRTRAGIGVKHPVYDFLFEYYSFRPSQLMRWSPGFGVLLENADRNAFDGAVEFAPVEYGLVLPAANFPEKRLKYLSWAISYLTQVADRPAQLSCFGMHEWAMVYQTDHPRYPDIPMRMTARQIAEVCEELGFRCSHYDAFRFFTPSARPRNALALSREETVTHDQPGCIHVTMDLYRFTYKIAPFIPAELMGDAFELAVAAREIDMRASPYNLEKWGFAPICIEDSGGRAEYISLQRALSLRAAPLRLQILELYRGLLAARQAECAPLPHADAAPVR